MIGVPAISQPHPGTSYKPTSDDRTNLILLAHEKVAEEEKQKEIAASSKENMLAAQRAAASEPQDGEVYLGMKIDEGDGDSCTEETSEEMDVLPANNKNVKKTKQQRRKAEQQKAEVCSVPFLWKNVAYSRFLTETVAP